MGALKDELVGVIMAQGYSFVPACEIASEVIGNGAGTYTIGNLRFTLRHRR